jgi:hypothetical protein
LREVWNSLPDAAANLLPALEAKFSEAREIQGEDLNSSASNSHSATSNLPGANTFTAAENARGWSQIIEGFRVARQFLQDCADYALDAFAVKHQGFFPSSLPAIVNPAVTVDPNNRWTRLARFYDVDSAKIIGQAVGDEAIYCWLSDNTNLLNIDHGVTESRGDYSDAIIGRSGGKVLA